VDREEWSVFVGDNGREHKQQQRQQQWGPTRVGWLAIHEEMVTQKIKKKGVIVLCNNVRQSL
jgi:hypothetical protein